MNVVAIDVMGFSDNCLAAKFRQIEAEINDLDRWPRVFHKAGRQWKNSDEIFRKWLDVKILGGILCTTTQSHLAF